MSSYVHFTRSRLTDEEQAECDRVAGLAEQLHRFLMRRSADIDAVHVHNARSGAVQSIVSELLLDLLGFEEEAVIPRAYGLVTSARPDFYFELGPGRGVIAEVERGGTTTNNHDLKDMWKAHISPYAHHLFLVVPMANWRADGTAREKPFTAVARRVGAFFGDPRREVDVLSVHLFGYGGTGLPPQPDIDRRTEMEAITVEVVREDAVAADALAHPS
ncbi:hypothetical protein [Georgenia faecalis]|uniref:Restriction endonuclease n=1 Tax=Georgenia faecalis TaxID=2483799 RepID=A0ABV9D929_9MICO|nr:hypothetical protein [Georgenia faecalis]